MGEVIRLRRPRKDTLRRAARESLTQALGANPKPQAVVIVVLAADGTFAMRSANDRAEISDFDMYARAEAVLTREKIDLLA